MLEVESHFSDFYKRSDAYAVKWQSRYLFAERVNLVFVISAAVAANFDRPGRVVVVVAFAGALCAHLFRVLSSADKRWWNGRAGAESAKTLCWRFCVCGDPFVRVGVDDDREFSKRITEVATKVADIAPSPSGQGHITDGMRIARGGSLSERIALYQSQRVRPQMQWYAGKSEWNDHRSTAWTLTLVLAHLVGIVLGLTLLSVDFDAVGVASALAASVAAWMAIKQHDILARSYAVASNELASIDSVISSTAWTEAAWAAFVGDAEEAISREHTSWRASRGV